MWEVGSASSFCVAPQQRHLLLGPSTTSVINQSEPHEGGSSGRFIFEPGSPPPSDIAHVTILGFNHYWTREVGRPEQLSNFTLPFGQVVAGLKFSVDGTNAQACAMRRSAVTCSNVGHRSQVRQSSGPIRQGSRSTVDSISSLTADVDEANVHSMCMTCAVDGPVALSRLSIIRGMGVGLAFALESVQCTYS